MKNTFKLLVPVAVAAIAFVSCQKEAENPAVQDNLKTVNITVKASAENLKGDTDTKTYIDDNQTILWGTGEYLKIAVTGGDTKFGNSSADYADAWDGSDEAYFGFTLEEPEAASSYLYQGLYPASAVVSSSNTNPESYKVTLPSSQNATASSYDPAAYIMIAEPESFSSLQSEWTASFRRATALNKVTLKNLDANVKSVKFVFPEGTDVAGRAHINLASGEVTDIYEGSNEVEVFFSSALAANDGADKTIWFTTWDANLAAGDKLTVIAKSEEKSYSREITARTEGIAFQQGYLNKLNINMSGITGEDLTDYSGDYLIGAMRNGTWNLMSSTNAGSYFSHTQTTVSTEASSIVYTDFNDAVDVNSYVWRVAKNENGYYIQNVETSAYLAIKNNSNESRAATSLTEEGLYPYFTIDIDSEGIASITSTQYTTRTLYGNAGSTRFAFYEALSSSQQAVYLIPAVYDPRTKVSLYFASTEISKTTENYSEFTGQTVSATPSVEGITYEMTGDAIGSINETSGVVTLNGSTGTATVTASFAGNTTHRNASASYTINVTTAGEPEYVQVTSLSDITAGTYVIVNGGWYLPNAAATSAGPAKSDATKVTVSSNKLVGVTDAMTWTFSGSTSAMTIKSTIEGDYYLVVSGAGNSNLRVNTTTGRTWTIAVNGTGTFSLKDNTNNRYCGAYASGSDWRSYTSATATNYADGGKVYLYKLTTETGGGSGEETGGDSGEEKTTVYTLSTTTTFSGNSDYTKTYEVTVNDVKWSASGANMTTAGRWRIGGKSINGVDRVIYGIDPIAGDADEIVIATNGVSSSNFTVNSITVTAHSTSDLAASSDTDANAISFTTDFDCSSFPKGSSADVTFTKVGNTSCAGYYYRIVFNVTNTNTSSNYGLDVNSITFFKN